MSSRRRRISPRGETYALAKIGSGVPPSLFRRRNSVCFKPGYILCGPVSLNHHLEKRSSVLKTVMVLSLRCRGNVGRLIFWKVAKSRVCVQRMYVYVFQKFLGHNENLPRGIICDRYKNQSLWSSKL